VFAGLLSPLVIALYGAAVQRGFTSVAEALKARAEAGLGEARHELVEREAGRGRRSVSVRRLA
jgi:hypothetical protein